jgi:hypothetical protein
MERTDVLELMATLKLYGMRAAYDEVMTTGIKRRHAVRHHSGEGQLRRCVRQCQPFHSGARP